MRVCALCCTQAVRAQPVHQHSEVSPNLSLADPMPRKLVGKRAPCPPICRGTCSEMRARPAAMPQHFYMIALRCTCHIIEKHDWCVRIIMRALHHGRDGPYICLTLRFLGPSSRIGDEQCLPCGACAQCLRGTLSVRRSMPCSHLRCLEAIGDPGVL